MELEVTSLLGCCAISEPPAPPAPPHLSRPCFSLQYPHHTDPLFPSPPTASPSSPHASGPPWLVQRQGQPDSPSRMWWAEVCSVAVCAPNFIHMALCACALLRHVDTWGGKYHLIGPALLPWSGSYLPLQTGGSLRVFSSAGLEALGPEPNQSGSCPETFATGIREDRPSIPLSL